MKGEIKKWYANQATKRQQKEKNLIAEIEYFDVKSEYEGLSSFECEIRSIAKGEWMELYLIDERNLIQKCKLQWLKGGDENTSFFHRFFAEKKRKLLISKLCSEDGNSHFF